MKKFYLLLITLILIFSHSYSQNNNPKVLKSNFIGEVPPLSSFKLKTDNASKTKKPNPFKHINNDYIIGKGSQAPDPLISLQRQAAGTRKSNPPSLVFEAGQIEASPTDPTGAIGPNHYVSAINSSFSIFDKSGNPLISQASLTNLWSFEIAGDPIVFYDNYAKRFVITQFSATPNSILMAICKGPDPVNDGWYTYRFETSEFPDFPKFSIWSDGYYVTLNANEDNVLILEREKLLIGDPSASVITFTSDVASDGPGSALAFNAIGPELPPLGDAVILGVADDSSSGSSNDRLDLYTVNVNWDTPADSTIELTQSLASNNGDITPFSLFNDNLPQADPDSNTIVPPGMLSQLINYRKFCNYNAVVLNFLVKTGNGSNEKTAIRWYELRQDNDTAPWTVYQEGTYTSPEGKSAFGGSISIDAAGNIGMGYSTIGTVSNGATNDSFIQIYYTGRLLNDPLNVMTIAEQAITTDGTANKDARYGDYAQLTIDPLDDLTFWHISEYFKDEPDNARAVVGVFKIEETTNTNDIAITDINNPLGFSNSEIISISITNRGIASQSNIPVSYQINGNPAIQETVVGTVNPNETLNFSFTTPADLTSQDIEIKASSNIMNDNNLNNDCFSFKTKKRPEIDIGFVELLSPSSFEFTSNNTEVMIRIRNFGTTSQSNIPVTYTFNNGTTITGTIPGPLNPMEDITYTFSQTVDLSVIGTYPININIPLTSDSDISNNSITTDIIKDYCTPYAPCDNSTFIEIFQLSNLDNTADIFSCNGVAYSNFTSETPANLIAGTNYTGSLLPFAFGGPLEMALWIDFNDNAIFELDEQLLGDFEIITVPQDFSISIPNNAPSGNHRMRVRMGQIYEEDIDGSVDAPCAPQLLGDTHDYMANIQNPLSNDEFIKENAQFDIKYLPNNQFDIKLESTFKKDLSLKVYTITGQKIGSYYLSLSKPNLYKFNLDMSYASSGAYLITVGSGNNMLSKKIIVN